MKMLLIGIGFFGFAMVSLAQDENKKPAPSKEREVVVEDAVVKQEKQPAKATAPTTPTTPTAKTAPNPAAAAAAAAAATAATSSFQNTTCKQGNNVRKVEISFTDAVKKIPCEVKYKKETESPGQEKVLWSANTSYSYCEEKATSLVGKLANDGWKCEKNKDTTQQPQ